MTTLTRALTAEPPVRLIRLGALLFCIDVWAGVVRLAMWAL